MDEFEIVPQLDLFSDLLLRFDDLTLERFDFIREFFDLNLLLPELVLSVFDNFLRLDLSGPGVLAVDQNLPMEIEGVFSDLLDRHVRLIKNGLSKISKY